MSQACSDRFSQHTGKSHQSSDKTSKLELAVNHESVITPPDVGIKPWIQVIGGFLLMFNSWGIVVSFGVFQTYYTSGGIKDESSPSKIAWIGSVQACLLLCVGAIGGSFFDAGYYRQMICGGAFLIVFGHMMTSISTKFYQVLLSQGIVTGMGMGLLLVPSVAIVSTWFVRRRGLAVGLVSSGSSIGGVAMPIMLDSLFPKIGFGWSVRILGFILLATSILSIAILRPRLPPRKGGRMLEYNALKELDFALYVTGMFVSFLGFYMFFNFVGTWARETHVDMKGLPVFYILPIVNAVSIIGRILPNFVSDYVGPLNIQAPSITMTGIIVLVWIPTRTLGPLIVIAILYGFFAGTFIAMPPTSVASMTEDLKTLGGRLGVMFLLMGISSLAGSPIIGAIIQHQNGSYDGARIWSGLVLILGSFIMIVARFVRTGGKLLAKA